MKARPVLFVLLLVAMLATACRTRQSPDASSICPAHGYNRPGLE